MLLLRDQDHTVGVLDIDTKSIVWQRLKGVEAIDILSHDICMENDSCSLEHFIDAMTYTVKGGLSSDINYQ